MELMLAKFATAKITKDLNPLKISSTGPRFLNKTLKCYYILLNGHPNWDLYPDQWVAGAMLYQLSYTGNTDNC